MPPFSDVGIMVTSEVAESAFVPVYLSFECDRCLNEPSYVQVLPAWNLQEHAEPFTHNAVLKYDFSRDKAR